MPPSRFSGGDQAYRFRFESLNSNVFRHGAILYCIAGFVLLELCGTAGLTLARDRGGARLFTLFIIAHVAPTLAAFASTRHRLPLMMLMTVTAADLAVGLPQSWRGRLLLSPRGHSGDHKLCAGTHRVGTGAVARGTRAGHRPNRPQVSWRLHSMSLIP